MGRKLADLEADMSDPTVSTDPVLFADVDLHLSYGERVGVERELAAAYRDSDYKLGDRLAQSLRRVEAKVEGLYAEWGAG
jgi:hypothetical protein